VLTGGVTLNGVIVNPTAIPACGASPAVCPVYVLTYDIANNAWTGTNPSTVGPAGVSGPAGATGATGATGPMGSQSFPSVQNAGTDVICAKGSDTITGITCNNSVDGTTETAFSATTTIPAGTLSNTTINVTLPFGIISTGSAPTVFVKIRLGGPSGTLVYQSVAVTGSAASTALTLVCSMTAAGAASTTTPIIVGCIAQSLQAATQGHNSLLSNTTLSIPVNTLINEAISVSVAWSANTVGNAAWLYGISPGSGGAVGATGATGVVTPFTTLTDGATVTWAIASAGWDNRILTFTTHGGSRTLNITGVANGGNYVLKLVQDATGGEGLILGTGCTWQILNNAVPATTVSLSSVALAVNVIAFTYDGTNCVGNEK